MCDKELLVGYLYDELQPAERTAFETHARSCAACREEVAALRKTRAHLTSWAPSEPELGFRIVSGAAAPAAAWWRPWGLAAAAALVLAATAAIANLEIRYDANGLVVRTGWASHGGAAPATPSRAEAPTLAAAPASEQWRAQLQLLDRRLSELETARPPSTPAAPANSARAADADVIRTVRRIIAESEQRQEREMAMRVAQVWKDIEAMRAADLVRIEQGLRQVQGVTSAELIQHRETLNRLVRVAQQR